MNLATRQKDLFYQLVQAHKTGHKGPFFLGRTADSPEFNRVVCQKDAFAVPGVYLADLEALLKDGFVRRDGKWRGKFRGQITQAALDAKQL